MFGWVNRLQAFHERSIRASMSANNPIGRAVARAPRWVQLVLPVIYFGAVGSLVYVVGRDRYSAGGALAVVIPALAVVGAALSWAASRGKS